MRGNTELAAPVCFGGNIHRDLMFARQDIRTEGVIGMLMRDKDSPDLRYG